jgi:hypothetical protein
MGGGMTGTEHDYAELWLMAQRAHKDIFEAALVKDWHQAMIHADLLENLAERMGSWLEDAHLRSVGK